ncbi:programmed cell death protein 2-like [Tubulanus polymorphus]|uniref:programmed cell death protein 2-like n=1 Tax=Tubulanus polymorphus TaxID=672921 RepID=UPI003DA3BA1F
MTSVLLGLCDAIVGETDNLDAKINKIGGKPDWYNLNTGITESFAPRCTHCNKALILVLQLYCPLDLSEYHRTLYIFVCPSKICSNQQYGWKVFRCQVKDHNFKLKEKEDLPVKKSTDLWCDGSDDWGDSEWGTQRDGSDDWGDSEWGTTTSAVDQQTIISYASITSKSITGNQDEDINDKLSGMAITDEDDEPTTSAEAAVTECIPEDMMNIEQAASVLNVLKSSTPETEMKDVDDELVSYYINAIEEPTDTNSSTTDNKHITDLLREYSHREGVNVSELLNPQSDKFQGSSAEKYEKPSFNHGDEIFHKFTRRMSRFPQQCLRYSWNGDPLLIHKHFTPQQTTCKYCNSKQVYEMQLMPGLIQFLKYQTFNGDSAAAAAAAAVVVEFGTVLIYTCMNSCWSETDSVKEETCLLQLDPDQHLFKT